MNNRTFVEKIFDASAGSIVFKKPDIILTHDNTASIFQTFKKMGGLKVKSPEQLLIVLDHNAPPTTAKLANQYQAIRNIVKEQGITKFHDAGKGICHQIMADYGDFSIDELKICTLRIAKRLGPQHAKKAIEYLDNNEVRNAFSIALSYYDKAYSYHKEINPFGDKIKIECPAKNYTEIANFLVNIKNGK